jgi:hypothetical protein
MLELDNTQKDTETEEAFKRRIYTKAKGARAKEKQPSIPARWFSDAHRWFGHVARMDQRKPLSQAINWKGQQWWETAKEHGTQEDEKNTQGWKHRSNGNAKGEKTETIMYCFNQDWKNEAKNRQQWINQEHTFVEAQMEEFRKTNDSIKRKTTKLKRQTELKAILEKSEEE